MKEIKLSDPLYETDIRLLIGGSAKDLIALMTKRHGSVSPMSWDQKSDWEEDADTTNGYQFHINAPFGYGEIFYIWIDELAPSLLAHEIFHLTGDILFTRGIVYSRESEEAFAYLNGWLFDKILKKLKIKFTTSAKNRTVHKG